MNKGKKQHEEKEAFLRFVAKLGQREEWTVVENRPEPEPDLLCLHTTDGRRAFELVSLTDESIAIRLAAGAKASIEPFSTADPSERIIRTKLNKRYQTSILRIDLLIYTESRIITPDDVIIPTIQPLFDKIPHPFDAVWFMGEFETRCLWSRL
ncbi:hypothetical protein [Massilia sp. YIM B04103]|uniref:hypothetical protein n=1 Tax=Massilia sp. YIM B04103 TaxID=2963106 RepID=UPI00210DB663|nr:hypothetical protein [Massilia sp. YIM B04103]